MPGYRKFLALIVMLLIMLPLVVHAQDALSGELTISFWRNVDAYEQHNADNQPWQAAYDLIKEWATNQLNCCKNVALPSPLLATSSKLASNTWRRQAAADAVIRCASP